jgi:hypothetical protein
MEQPSRCEAFVNCSSGHCQSNWRMVRHFNNISQQPDSHRHPVHSTLPSSSFSVRVHMPGTYCQKKRALLLCFNIVRHIRVKRQELARAELNRTLR